MSQPSDLVAAYIAAQAALRARSGAQMAALWAALPHYDRANIPAFLSRAVPLAQATKAASVRITSAFVGHQIAQPVTVLPSEVVIRNGANPADVYSRPFVNVWTDLKNGTGFEEAKAAGANRAKSAVQMDAQLAMRETLRVAGQKSELILGYRRVPDPGACDFCVLISGQRYTTDMLMPVHNHCGCGVEVITESNRGDFTGNRANDLTGIERITQDGVTVAIVDHGELGPLVVNGDDHFTGPAALAA